MRNFLNKQIKIKTLTIIAMILIVSSSTLAMTRSEITAVLSPDITVRYNGVKQEMKDANGNPVYPITYNGTTYLPVRAVSNMLNVPVDWESSTQTVLLGENKAPSQSLITAANLIENRRYNDFTVVTGFGNIKQPVDDFGNIMNVYHFGLHTGASMGHINVELESKYDTLEFIVFAEGEERQTRTVSLRNTNNTVTYETITVNRGTFTPVTFNISGLTSFRIQFGGGSSGRSWILEPVVK